MFALSTCFGTVGGNKVPEINPCRHWQNILACYQMNNVCNRYLMDTGLYKSTKIKCTIVLFLFQILECEFYLLELMVSVSLLPRFYVHLNKIKMSAICHLFICTFQQMSFFTYANLFGSWLQSAWSAIVQDQSRDQGLFQGPYSGCIAGTTNLSIARDTRLHLSPLLLYQCTMLVLKSDHY